MNTRNVILLAGLSGAGKTAAIRYINDTLPDGVLKLPPLTDSHTIFHHMEIDDATRRGRNHDHPWCPENDFHVHDAPFKTKIPFTITTRYSDEDIIFGMQRDFFEKLAQLPSDGLRVAELSHGVNGNRREDPASGTDLSAATIANRLTSGEYDTTGLLRIYAVVCITADYSTRLQLNEGRLQHPPGERDIANGLASWGLDRRGMAIFMHDDFSKLEPTLQRHGINRVLQIQNDGRIPLEGQLQEQLFPLLDEWLRDWFGRETGRVRGWRR